MHVNKVHPVTSIGRVAKDLGEDEDWLSDVTNGMDPEDKSQPPALQPLNSLPAPSRARPLRPGLKASMF